MPSLEIPSGTRQRTELTLCSLMTNYSVEVPVPRFQLWDLRQVASLLSCLPVTRGHSQYLPTRGKWGVGRVCFAFVSARGA